MIEFRKLTKVDYPLLLDWLGRRHIKQYWNDSDDSLEKIAAHYAINSVEAKYYIAQQDGQDIGFYQYCCTENGDIGIDMFLAYEQQLSRGLGTKCLNAFGDFVVGIENCQALSVDPHPSNLRGIRCYEKCGYVYDEKASSVDIYFMIKKLN